MLLSDGRLVAAAGEPSASGRRRSSRAETHPITGTCLYVKPMLQQTCGRPRGSARRGTGGGLGDDAQSRGREPAGEER